MIRMRRVVEKEEEVVACSGRILPRQLPYSPGLPH